MLARFLPNTETWVYGSRVRWTSRPESDLDMVVFTTPEQASAVSNLREAFDESDLTFRVDLFVWDNVPPEFRHEIEREHLVLVESAVCSRGWKQRQLLGDCILMNEDTYSPKEKWPFVNYLETGNISENRIEKILHIIPEREKLPSRARRKARSGEIVYSTVRPNQRHFGILREVPENFLASTGFAIFRGKEAIADTGFIYRFLIQDHVVEQLHTIAEHSTSAYPSIRPADIERLEISLPPIAEQRTIANILGKLDDKIELNRLMNETLEAMARAIFKDWFIDFGPTRAKAEGRAPYIATEFWDLFPDALDAKGKPVGWTTRPVRDLFDFNPKESVKKGTKTPYLGMAALPTAGSVSHAPTKLEYKSGSKFRDGDTLFARITPCLENGKTAYVFDLGNEVIGAGSTEFIVIRSRSALPQSASYLLARDMGFRTHAERGMTGTSGRQRVNAEILGQYEITAPKNDCLWKALAKLVDPIMDSVIANALESRTLGQTRDLLLPGLVSGELCVPEKEKFDG